MPESIFTFKAIDARGKEVSGRVNARDASEAEKNLERDGYYMIVITPFYVPGGTTRQASPPPRGDDRKKKTQKLSPDNFNSHSPMRTHYDNLKIAEGAPDEVVKAAYRALSHRYHPDKNPGNTDAGRIMQILNHAYETLSDPISRQQYDAFLAQARQAQQTAAKSRPPPPIHPQPRPQPRPAPAYQRPQRSFWNMLLRVLCWDFRLTLFALIFAGAGIVSLFEQKRPKQPYSPHPPTTTYTRFDPSTAVPVEAPTIRRPVRPSYVRPATAPNGRTWPVYASYVPDYPLVASGGLSSVSVDNTRNSSDVFLKLVSLDSPQAYPVRVCFIPAFSQFKFQTVAPGRYDVRYRDLSSGGCSKTEEFTLTETKTYRGTEFDNFSLTLYKVANGNMHTQTIDESEF